MKKSIKISLKLVFLIILADVLLMGVLYYIGLKDGGYYRISNFDLKDSSAAISYHKSAMILGLTGTIVSILSLIFILNTGLSSILRDLSMKIGKNEFLGYVIYILLFFIIYYLLNLPLNFYSNYIFDHSYGMSNQTLGRFFTSGLLNLLVSAVSYGIIFYIPFKLYKKYPRRWFIYTFLLSIPVMIFIYILSPLYIDPIFNKFKPLEDGKVKSSIIELTKKANIKDCKIFLVDKSKDTSALNAYMTGIGYSKRIVIWDTSLKEFTQSELNFIVAHEIGHYVLSHIYKSIIFEAVLIFLFLFLIHKILPLFILDFGRLFRIDNLKDFAIIPLVILILNISIFFISPITSFYSRYDEHEADTFALELTQDNKAGEEAFNKLSKGNLSIFEPNKFYLLWFYDHPSLRDRIIFTREYKPYENGEEGRYSRFLVK